MLYILYSDGSLTASNTTYFLQNASVSSKHHLDDMIEIVGEIDIPKNLKKYQKIIDGYKGNKKGLLIELAKAGIKIKNGDLPDFENNN